MSNQIVPASQQMKTLAEALQKAKGSMSAVAARVVTPDKLIKIAIAAAQRTPLLLQCSPASIVRAVMQGAELGLTPGSALNQAYLVPFRNNQTQQWEAQLIVSAQGLCELAYRSGLISFVSVEVVYEGDDFQYVLGTDPKLVHVPKDETIEPDKITHAYIVVRLKDGAVVFRVMTKKGIDRIMQRSPSFRSKAGPWFTDYAEMARKTVAKNGFKYVPKSIEVARAIALDTAHETGDYTSIDFDIPESLPAGEPEAPADEPKATTKLADKIKGKHGEFSEVDAHLTQLGLTENEIRDWHIGADAAGVAEELALRAEGKEQAWALLEPEGALL